MNEQLTFEWLDTEKEEGVKSESPSVFVTLDEILKVYFWGVSEGQVMMEEERIGEELTDSAVCYQSGRKYGIPSSPIRRRQIHSEKWFEVMMRDKKNFMDFLAQKTKGGSE